MFRKKKKTEELLPSSPTWGVSWETKAAVPEASTTPNSYEDIINELMNIERLSKTISAQPYIVKSVSGGASTGPLAGAKPYTATTYGASGASTSSTSSTSGYGGGSHHHSLSTSSTTFTSNWNTCPRCGSMYPGNATHQCNPVYQPNTWQLEYPEKPSESPLIDAIKELTETCKDLQDQVDEIWEYLREQEEE